MNAMKKNIYVSCFLCFLMMVSLVFAQEANVQIVIEKITDHISVLKNGGGNVGVCIGEDGVLLVDTMMNPFSKELKGTLDKISADKPIRFAINTHWHYDHIEGNEAMAKAGATIIAHENVRMRNSTEQYVSFFAVKMPPAPAIALPTITFTHDITLHINGEDVYVLHLQPGHTDGDAIVFFRKANVVHVGDLCFAGMYPFIDTSSGGSITGMIAVLNRVLPMLDDATKIIPGHGPLTNKAELSAYTAMLTSLRDKFSQQINAGKTLETMLRDKITQEFDAVWGQGFWKPEQFTKLLYSDLIRGK